MLFIQQINITWEKDVRYANYANARRDIKFFPIDFDSKDINGEILYNCVDVCQMPDGIHHYTKKKNGTKILSNDALYSERSRSSFLGDRVFIKLNDNEYDICYTSNKYKEFIKTVFSLKNGQTGRIIYNYRDAYYDYDCRTWYYKQIVFNLVCTEKDNFKPKIFYVKNPDFVFKDLRMMSYNGN